MKNSHCDANRMPRYSVFLSLSVALCLLTLCRPATAEEATTRFAGERKRNNLVAELLEVASIGKSGGSFAFTRATPGWVFISAECQGKGTIKIVLDKDAANETVLVHEPGGSERDEAMRHVAAGQHHLEVSCDGDVRVERLIVKSIPELIHCGLGFNPAIKSYGLYDMEFLKKDILPNVTTLIVPSNIAAADGVNRRLAPPGEEVRRRGRHQRPGENGRRAFPILDRLHRQGAVSGRHHHRRVHRQQSGHEPGRDSAPSAEAVGHGAARDTEYSKRLFASSRPTSSIATKMVYAYIGGSGKKLNQEIIGPTFVPAIIDCGYRIALERYLHEISSEQKSKDALQLFVDGIADWEAKEPGVHEPHGASPSGCSRCRPAESTSSRTSITTSGWTSR